MEITNAQKAARLEEMAANREADSRGLHDLAEKLGLSELQKQKAVTIAMADADAALLRECAAMMRERGGISWTSEDRGHGMVLTSAVYRNRLIAIVGRSRRTFFWTVSKVAAREHEEFGTADTPEAAQAAAIAWVDENEGRNDLARERETVQWDEEGGATKNGLYLWAGPVRNGFASLVLRGKRRLYLDGHPTLEAAQAAAVAWVDEQEGRDV